MNRMSGTTIRVAIVDDHTMLREGLRKILSMEEDLEVVADTDEARKAGIPPGWLRE